MNRQGYDVEVENDDLYPQRSHTSVRRYIPVEQRDAQQPQQPQQRMVMRSRPQQQQLRTPNQYDTMNVFVRQRRVQRTSARPQAPVTPRPAQVSRHAVPIQDDDELKKTEPLRPPTTAVPPVTKQKPKRHWRFHWLVPVGVGALATVLLLFVLSDVLNWWSTMQDDWHYGRPRTAQYDAVIGHNHDSPQHPSHFIALNLNRHIEIIEFPGGDATKAKVYLGPTLFEDREDLTPVTLEFKALKPDGKLDMIVHVGDNKVVFINDNGAFRLVQPGDNITTV
jgi:hypothetical protein